MERKTISIPGGPQDLFPDFSYDLPFSLAIKMDNLIFTSGATARDPKTRKPIGGDIKEQTEQVLQNQKATLEAAGSSLDKVAKVTVFLTDMNDFFGMNEVYRKFFPKNPPARSTVQVVKLPVDARVEIEMIAGL